MQCIFISPLRLSAGIPHKGPSETRKSVKVTLNLFGDDASPRSIRNHSFCELTIEPGVGDNTWALGVTHPPIGDYRCMAVGIIIPVNLNSTTVMTLPVMFLGRLALGSVHWLKNLRWWKIGPCLMWAQPEQLHYHVARNIQKPGNTDGNCISSGM